MGRGSIRKYVQWSGHMVPAYDRKSTSPFAVPSMTRKIHARRMHGSNVVKVGPSMWLRVEGSTPMEPERKRGQGAPEGTQGIGRNADQRGLGGWTAREINPLPGWRLCLDLRFNAAGFLIWRDNT